jgi:glyoxylate reductase
MSDRRVLVLGDFPGRGLERLQAVCAVTVRAQGVANEEELAELVPGYQGLLTQLTQRVDESVFAAAADLRIVANCAVGVDNIDLSAATRHGVVVTNTPDVLTDDTADLTWALILALLRGVVSGDRLLRRGEFHGWEPKMSLGHSLCGTTLGVIGAGRIGRAVLQRAPVFGVRTLYHQRHRLPEDVESRLGSEWRSLEDLLHESRVVSLHASLNDSSHHLLNEARLRSMQPGSFLVNTARGPLIDEDALARLLREGHLAGAGLDVYEREPEVTPALLEMENVVLLPHIGSATWETRTRMADCCFEDLITLLVDNRTPKRALVEGPRQAGAAKA